MSEMYGRMKALGKDMGWYERGKQGRTAGSPAIPLDDQECAKQSIYYLKADGSLWTLKDTAAGRAAVEPYHQVRTGAKEIGRAVYVCVTCRQQWNQMPSAHGTWGVKTATEQ